MKIYFSGTALLMTMQLFSCTVDVEETPDAKRIVIEVPKVDAGDQPADANPATDGDIDVDTPLPGDS